RAAGSTRPAAQRATRNAAQRSVFASFHSVGMNRSVEKGNVFGATHSVRNVSTNILEAFLRNVGFRWQGCFSTERSIPNGMAQALRIENCGGQVPLGQGVQSQ
ncbi:MAG: hypothetical protein LBB79_08740, partial [Prevotellaceae bacterium]|nr:hypothetical protein [Prevotellaceae bacterium]